MSRIDDLIAEHCPGGVEHRTLSDVGSLVRGKRFVKTDMIEAGVPCIHYGEIYTKYGSAATKSVSYVSEELSRSLRFAQPGDVIIASAGETIADIGKSVAWLGDEAIAIHDACYAYSSSMDAKYLSYFFSSRAFREQIRPHISSSKISSISPQNITRAKVPVPPVAIQREIAAILDKMERFRIELETELELRFRQYAFYRDSLLTFAERDEVRWLTFGEAATIMRGASPRPIQAFLTNADEGVNWIKIGDVARGGKYITSTAEKIKPEGAVRSRRVEPGDFVLSNSMSFGRPYIVQIDGCIHDGWLAIKDFSATYNHDFLYHLLRTSSVYREMAARAGAGTVQNLNANIVKSLLLPAPPLEEQLRIVATLDKFDVLVNDLSAGLPAEIRAREAQYEYYRDKLLTFEELAV